MHAITCASLTLQVDTGDKIDFICKGIGAASNVTDIDMTNPAWLLSLTTELTDCKKVVTGPGGIVGLIVACVQGGLLVTLGPAILIYGPSFKRFVALIQAIIVSSYILLINSIISINAFTAFLTVERAVTFVIATLTVTYTSLNNPGARARAAGFALGSLIGGPLMDFVSTLCYQHALGCKGMGDKTEYFPNGTPMGCDLNSVSFQAVFQLTLFGKWLIIVGSAYYGKKTINFSTATAGGTMIVKGTIDLVKAIGFQVSPESSISIIAVITPSRTWVTYGVAILGFLIQRKLLEEKPTSIEDETKTETVRKDPQPKAMLIIFGLLLKICDKIDAFLGRHLETLKDGGKGALVRALTRKKIETPTKETTTTTKEDEVEVKVVKKADDKDSVEA